MFVPLYDTTNGQFKGIKEILVYITLRDNKNEQFLLTVFQKKTLKFFSLLLNKSCLMCLLALLSKIIKKK